MDLEVGKLFYVLNDNGTLASDTLYEKILTRELDRFTEEPILPNVPIFGAANARVAKSQNIKGSQNENMNGYLDFIPLNLKVMPHDKPN